MPENPKNGSHSDAFLIPNNKLRSALDEISTVLGPVFHESIFDRLGQDGIDLSGADSKYSLTDIRLKLNLLLGESVADMIIEKMREWLKNNQKW